MAIFTDGTTSEVCLVSTIQMTFTLPCLQYNSMFPSASAPPTSDVAPPPTSRFTSWQVSGGCEHSSSVWSAVTTLPPPHVLYGVVHSVVVHHHIPAYTCSLLRNWPATCLHTSSFCIPFCFNSHVPILTMTLFPFQYPLVHSATV